LTGFAVNVDEIMAAGQDRPMGKKKPKGKKA
jgi:hypothetical protein